jgi:Rps23 Pro-64 3,4-dihydroxylase Tpa1-like proline 4-hydroxylase
MTANANKVSTTGRADPVASQTARYSLTPDFLDAGSHASVLAFSLANEARLAPSLVSDGDYHPFTRTSRSLHDLGPVGAVLSERIRLCAPNLCATLGIAAFDNPTLETELVAYGDGAYFRRHRDVAPGVGPVGNQSARAISTVYYFHAEPKAFTGGALRLFAIGADGGLGDFVDIPPTQNSLVAFPSDSVHEVLPVSCPSGSFRHSRFAINCWIHR